jgi:hypothetical protein
MENRPKKVRHFLNVLHKLPKKESHIDLWYRLDTQIERYMSLDIPWDGKLIETIGKIKDIKFRQKEISTFDSVMDTAREFLYE